VNGELTRVKEPTLPDILFVNTRDARRSPQRETRFGFTLGAVNHNAGFNEILRLGVFLTMPACFGKVVPCQNHREKYSSNEFYSLFAMNQLCMTTVSIPGESNFVKVFSVPYAKADDPYICSFQFQCYSSCFSQLSPKSFIKIHYLVLSPDNRVEKKDMVLSVTYIMFHILVLYDIIISSLR